ncbi:alpha/beta fold hydrolase [Nocardia wallacei]|uniref:Putative hydrolase YraK n=1 Tax=Nocardia wallacei TaxID=480035 RepID=A0A7G1KL41_9NOCA|nr:alpha/beta fold hydrolase [Nocardia wallacei]BCK55922.1 putative hydrolase YraK [Nocardia wallacei]
MTTDLRTGTVRVPGATLHYELRGTGPLLLISDSGGGEVRRSTEIAARLGDAFTVVTYDRRGFARSPLDRPGSAVPVAVHAEDLRLLLAELTDQPAHVLGCALGALPALHAVLAAPAMFATVVAHEPLAPALLTGADRAEHVAAFEELEADYRERGLPAAVVRISAMLGAGAAARHRVQHSLDHDAGRAADPAVAGQRTANFDFILTNEIPQARTTPVDVPALRNTPVPIVAAAGEATDPALFGSRCAHALAAALDTTAVTFPGGHNAHFTHPVEYARRLRDVLGRQSAPAQP